MSETLVRQLISWLPLVVIFGLWLFIMRRSVGRQTDMEEVARQNTEAVRENTEALKALVETLQNERR